MSGGPIGPESEAAEPLALVLGSIIQELRTEIGLKQEEAAVALGVSLSAYSKWEEGSRTPAIKNIEKLCRVFQADDWRSRKLMSLASSGVKISVGTWPPELSEEDKDVLDNMGFPAIYRKLPEYEIIRANDAWLRVYPMFAPAPEDSPRPANMIELLFTDWRSRVVFVDWDMVAWRATYMMRLWSRGIARARLEEIQNACSAVAPEFERMWEKTPPKSHFATNRISVRDVVNTNKITHWTLCSWFNNYPPRPYEILASPPRSPKLIDDELNP
ncbi:helix-turn-helix domain-containing protein [Nocardia sp. XZ_19_369]|uniref:helix-turn-helix domain-containing protein n=1 Tax=Nocardia sp. XZ_19_369 TaxID=2769487 RepID=UPI00188FB13B|nr:helix-turn-helix domain-containing protein [Nocardia sp. XZ_19_369]